MTAASTSDARKRNAAQVDPVEVVEARDLIARLGHAARSIDALVGSALTDKEAARLGGKSEGCRLAISYIREMKREATS